MLSNRVRSDEKDHDRICMRNVPVRLVNQKIIACAKHSPENIIRVIRVHNDT